MRRIASVRSPSAVRLAATRAKNRADLLEMLLPLVLKYRQQFLQQIAHAACALIECVSCALRAVISLTAASIWRVPEAVCSPPWRMC